MTQLNPKLVTLTSLDGDLKKTFAIGKIPAIPCREIVCKYPMSALPRIGDYGVNEETMLKLMAYVSVETPAGMLALTSRDLVNNHVTDFEMLAKLEWLTLEHNVGFLRSGGNSDFLKTIAAKARPFASKILTDLLEQSFPKS